MHRNEPARGRLRGGAVGDSSPGDEFSPRLACVAQSLPRFDDLLVFLPNPFFTGMPRDMYTLALSRVRLGPAARLAGDGFVNSTLRGRPFVGVHLRWFEGICEPFCTKAFHGAYARFLSDCMTQCYMPWPYVSRVMAAHGFDPETSPVFLATDNQRPNLTAALLAHPNVYMWNESSGGAAWGGGAQARLVDMHVLSRAALFLGHPVSSFAFHVALLRELGGHARSTNILAGYQEAGYLHHLFWEHY